MLATNIYQQECRSKNEYRKKHGFQIFSNTSSLSLCHYYYMSDSLQVEGQHRYPGFKDRNIFQGESVSLHIGDHRTGRNALQFSDFSCSV